MINPDATLTVRAPIHISLAYIEKLINQKQRWIKRKLDEIKSRPAAKPKEFVDGEEFFYLGKIYGLKIVESKTIFLDDYLYFPKSMLPDACARLMQWYKAQAAKKITERVGCYAKEAGLTYKSIKITQAQRRWGSCSHNGNLNFSWRLVMAPLQVIDYVVAHELAHLGEMNHSPRFWQKVKLFFPNYKQAEKWFKHNGHKLRV